MTTMTTNKRSTAATATDLLSCGISSSSVSLFSSSSSPSIPDRDDDEDESDDLDVHSFQSEIAKRQQQQPSQQQNDDVENTDDDSNNIININNNTLVDFDGYMFRNVLVHKWGACWDVEFQKFDTLGQRKLYLNILPFQLGRRPFRHATEYDYLCHLQAVVEILIKYQQLDHVLYQIQDTHKKPRPGTSPLVAVPLRLDLSQEQVDRIMGYLK